MKFDESMLSNNSLDIFDFSKYGIKTYPHFDKEEGICYKIEIPGKIDIIVSKKLGTTIMKKYDNTFEG
jgi:hypothetical protein